MEIGGAVTVIRGGGSGIGRALALEMARSGAVIAIAVVNEASALDTAQEIQPSAAALALAEGLAHVEAEHAMKPRMAQRGLPAEESARTIVRGIRDDRFLI
jgi:NAD(P)-dependent dehydrogenase (short-subunit alcohol dehydrogenase family)